MRSARARIAGALLLSLAAAAPAVGQVSQEKPKQGQDDRGQRRQPDAKPVPPGLTSREPQAQPQRQNDDRDQREDWQRRRAHTWRYEHHDWRERGGYDGFRIPSDRFRDAFGRDHPFRVHGLPRVVIGGFPRFQFGGYWFRLVDPWPESWADDWYETDDVYIDLIDDGYYLHNLRHPDDLVAVRVYAE